MKCFSVLAIAVALCCTTQPQGTEGIFLEVITNPIGNLIGAITNLLKGALDNIMRIFQVNPSQAPDTVWDELGKLTKLEDKVALLKTVADGIPLLDLQPIALRLSLSLSKGDIPTLINLIMNKGLTGRINIQILVADITVSITSAVERRQLWLDLSQRGVSINYAEVAFSAAMKMSVTAKVSFLLEIRGYPPSFNIDLKSLLPRIVSALQGSEKKAFVLEYIRSFTVDVDINFVFNFALTLPVRELSQFVLDISNKGLGVTLIQDLIKRIVLGLSGDSKAIFLVDIFSVIGSLRLPPGFRLEDVVLETARSAFAITPHSFVANFFRTLWINYPSVDSVKLLVTWVQTNSFYDENVVLILSDWLSFSGLTRKTELEQKLKTDFDLLDKVAVAAMKESDATIIQFMQQKSTAFLRIFTLDDLVYRVATKKVAVGKLEAYMRLVKGWSANVLSEVIRRLLLLADPQINAVIRILDPSLGLLPMDIDQILSVIIQFVQQNPPSAHVQFIVDKVSQLTSVELRVQLLKKISERIPSVDIHSVMLSFALKLTGADVVILIKKISETVFDARFSLHKFVVDYSLSIVSKVNRLQFLLNLSQSGIQINFTDVVTSISLSLSPSERILFLVEINTRKTELRIDIMFSISKILQDLPEIQKKEFFVACIRAFPAMFDVNFIVNYARTLTILQLPQLIVDLSGTDLNAQMIRDVMKQLTLTLAGDSKFSFLAEIYVVIGRIKLPAGFRFEDFLVEIASAVDPSMPHRVITSFLNQLWMSHKEINVPNLLVDWSKRVTLISNNAFSILSYWMSSITLDKQIELFGAIKTLNLGINIRDLVASVAISVSDTNLSQFITQVANALTGVVTLDDILYSIALKINEQGKLQTFLLLIKTSLPNLESELIRRLRILNDPEINRIINNMYPASPPSDIDQILRTITQFMQVNPISAHVPFIVNKISELTSVDLKVQLLKKISEQIPSVDINTVTLSFALKITRSDVVVLIKKISETVFGPKFSLQKLIVDYSVSVVSTGDRLQFLLSLSQSGVQINFTEVVASISLRLFPSERIIFLTAINPRKTELRIDLMVLIPKVLQGLPEIQKKAFFIACIRAFSTMVDINFIVNYVKTLPIIQLPQVFVDLSGTDLNAQMIRDVMKQLTLTLTGNSKFSFLAEIYVVIGRIKLPAGFRFEDFLVEIANVVDPSMPHRVITSFFNQLWMSHKEINVPNLLVDWSNRVTLISNNVFPILSYWMSSITLDKQIELFGAIKALNLSLSIRDLVASVAINVSDTNLSRFITQVANLLTGVVTIDDIVYDISIKKKELGKLQIFLLLIKTSQRNVESELIRRLLLLSDPEVTRVITNLYPGGWPVDLDKMALIIVQQITQKPPTNIIEYIVSNALILPTIELKVQFIKKISERLPQVDVQSITLTMATRLPLADIATLMKLLGDGQYSLRVDLQKLLVDIVLALPSKDDHLQLLLNVAQLGVRINMGEALLSIVPRLSVDARLSLTSDVLLRLTELKIDNVAYVVKELLKTLAVDKQLELLRMIKDRVPTINVMELVADLVNSLPDIDLFRFINEVSTIFLTVFSKVDLIEKIGIIKKDQGTLKDYLLFIKINIPDIFDVYITRLQAQGDPVVIDIINSVISALPPPTISLGDVDGIIRSILKFIQDSPLANPLEFILQKVMTLSTTELKVQLLAKLSMQISSDLLHNVTFNLAYNLDHTEISAMIRLIEADAQLMMKLDLPKLVVEIGVHVVTQTERIVFLEKLVQLGVILNMNDVVLSIGNWLPASIKISFMADILSHLAELKIDDVLSILRGWMINLELDLQLQLLQEVKRVGIVIDVLELVAEVSLRVPEMFLLQFINGVSTLYSGVWTLADLLHAIALKQYQQGQLEIYLNFIKVNFPDVVQEIINKLALLGDAVVNDIIKRLIVDVAISVDQAVQLILKYIQDNPIVSPLQFIIDNVMKLNTNELKVELLIKLSISIPSPLLFNVTFNVAYNLPHADIPAWIKLVADSELARKIDLNKLVSDISLYILVQVQDIIAFLLHLVTLGVRVNINEVVVSIGAWLPVDVKISFMSEVLGHITVLKIDNLVYVVTEWFKYLSAESQVALLKLIKTLGLAIDIVDLVVGYALTLSYNVLHGLLTLVSSAAIEGLNFIDLLVKLALKKFEAGQLQEYLGFVKDNFSNEFTILIGRLEILNNPIITGIIKLL